MRANLLCIVPISTDGNFLLLPCDNMMSYIKFQIAFDEYRITRLNISLA